MSNTRKINQATKDYGNHRIKTMEIIDLTQTNEDIAVVMKMTRNVSTSDSIKDSHQAIKDSPWHEDDLAKSYVERREQTKKLQDPVSRLRKINEILGRR